MKFLIVGGDQRAVRLTELLKKDGHKVKTFGLEKAKIQEVESLKEQNQSFKIEKITELEQLKYIEMQQFDAIIGPIPFTKDGENLNAPFAENKISIDNLLQLLKNTTMLTGPISETLNERIKKYSIKPIDFMKIEELVIYNTIATAEGAIELAIANSEINLHDSKILILGFGRVASTLALKLKSLSTNITCAARKKSVLAWIETLGFKAENINNLEQNLKEYDIIINTVPQIILTEEKAKNIKKDALIIELASKPGGIEPQAIEESAFKYIFAPGLPGKVAPLSSAKYIKQAIYNIIKI